MKYQVTRIYGEREQDIVKLITCPLIKLQFIQKSINPINYEKYMENIQKRGKRKAHTHAHTHKKCNI